VVSAITVNKVLTAPSFSPFNILLSYVAPAFSAYRVKSALIVDVDLDVCASAFSVPWVSTVFSLAI